MVCLWSPGQDLCKMLRQRRSQHCRLSPIEVLVAVAEAMVAVVEEMAVVEMVVVEERVAVEMVVVAEAMVVVVEERVAEAMAVVVEERVAVEMVVVEEMEMPQLMPWTARTAHSTSPWSCHCCMYPQRTRRCIRSGTVPQPRRRTTAQASTQTPAPSAEQIPQQLPQRSGRWLTPCTRRCHRRTSR